MYRSVECTNHPDDNIVEYIDGNCIGTGENIHADFNGSIRGDRGGMSRPREALESAVCVCVRSE